MYRIVGERNQMEGSVTWTMDGYEYTRIELRKLVVVRTQT
jgi:hypothetical protein